MTRKSTCMSFLIQVANRETFVNFIFHAGFLRALWVQRSRHTLLFWRTRRTSRSRGLARKQEFHLLRFDQQITHETFAEISERVTHTLNSFPIVEIDKTIKVNEQAFAIKNSIKWRGDEIWKLTFVIVAMSSAKNHTMKSRIVMLGNVTRCTVVWSVRVHVLPSGYL